MDDALSLDSTNPVQNKVVTAALAGKASTATATQSAAGLWSAADKVKLDGLSGGGRDADANDGRGNAGHLGRKLKGMITWAINPHT